MEQIKNDIIKVLNKYVEIDLEGLDIKISQTESDVDNGFVPALFANIPIKEMRAKSDKSSECDNSRINNKNNRTRTAERTTIITKGSNEKLKV